MLYEVVAGFYVWRKRPLASGNAVWFLVINLAFAALFYGVTGGIGSVYYYPFAMVTAYAALALKAVPAAVFILCATALHTVVGALLVPRAQWNAEVVGVAVGESVVLLALGGVVLYFTGMVRRDAQAHDAARAEAQRRALLNEMALRLAEHGLDLARVGQTIVEAARRLPQTEYVLLVWRGNGDQQPHVVSSTSAQHTEGEHLAGLEWPTALRRVVGMGAGYATPLPAAFARDPVRQVILATSALPDGATPGAICFGRQADQPLTPDEQAYVQELAAEAGLAIRNARLYARELEQVERLHRFQNLQTTYFAAVAHEMKTPLTVLRTLAPSLRRLPELPDETRREILDAIDGNLARLEWSINGPLKAARLEAGVIVLRPRPLDLVGYIQQVAERLSPWLDLKRQQVLITAARDLPLVLADSSQIDHVIANLLVNAIKYGPDDSTIGVDLQPTGEVMQVCVEDEGPGVPPRNGSASLTSFTRPMRRTPPVALVWVSTSAGSSCTCMAGASGWRSGRRRQPLLLHPRPWPARRIVGKAARMKASQKILVIDDEREITRRGAPDDYPAGAGVAGDRGPRRPGGAGTDRRANRPTWCCSTSRCRACTASTF